MSRTLRDIIETGGRGGFAKALLTFYDDVTLENLMGAYSVADSKNREALDKVIPHVKYIHDVWCNATEEQLRQLECVFEKYPSEDRIKDKMKEHFRGLNKLDESGLPHELHSISIR